MKDKTPNNHKLIRHKSKLKNQTRELDLRFIVQLVQSK